MYVLHSSPLPSPPIHMQSMYMYMYKTRMKSSRSMAEDSLVLVLQLCGYCFDDDILSIYM